MSELSIERQGGAGGLQVWDLGTKDIPSNAYSYSVADLIAAAGITPQEGDWVLSFSTLWSEPRISSACHMLEPYYDWQSQTNISGKWMFLGSIRGTIDEPSVSGDGGIPVSVKYVRP